MESDMNKNTARKRYQIRVTDRELAAILAGLRLLQGPARPAGLLEVLTYGGKFESLTNREIDALAERLTFST